MNGSLNELRFNNLWEMCGRGVKFCRTPKEEFVEDKLVHVLDRTSECAPRTRGSN